MDTYEHTPIWRRDDDDEEPYLVPSEKFLRGVEQLSPSHALIGPIATLVALPVLLWIAAGQRDVRYLQPPDALCMTSPGVSIKTLADGERVYTFTHRGASPCHTEPPVIVPIMPVVKSPERLP